MTDVLENVSPVKETNSTKKGIKKNSKPTVSAAKLFGLAESKLKNKTTKNEPTKSKQSKKPETPNVKSKKEAEKTETDNKPNVDEIQETKCMSNVPEEWTRPFKLGWRREIVYRGVQNPTKQNRQCDIYYFTPENVKLRSIPMITDYLAKKESDLTKECFTFSKQKIFNEPQETVRNAGDKTIPNKGDETPEAKVVSTKKVKSNVSVQPSEKPSNRRKSRRAEKENIEDSLNDSMKEDIKEIMNATLPILDSTNNDVKKKTRSNKGKKRKTGSDDESLNNPPKKVKLSEEEGNIVKKDDLASDEDDKELLSMSLSVLANNEKKRKKSNRGKKRKSGDESENEVAKKIALNDETESNPKQDESLSNLENEISDTDNKDLTNMEEESHINESIEDKSMANDSTKLSETSDNHDKSVEDETSEENDKASDDNISMEKGTVSDEKEMSVDEKSESNANDIAMDDEIGAVCNQSDSVKTNENDLELEDVETDKGKVELDETEVDKKEVESERDENADEEKEMPCDEEKEMPNDEKEMPNDEEKEMPCDDENVDLFQDELSEDKENIQDSMQGMNPWDLQLNEDRVFREISAEQENCMLESTEDVKKIDDVISNEDNVSSDKDTLCNDCAPHEGEISRVERENDDNNDLIPVSLHSFLVDEGILRCLDVTKKFYLHIENEQRLIEPGSTSVENGNLNIRLKVPLPPEIMRRTSPSLQMTVENKDDMQVLLARFIE